MTFNFSQPKLFKTVFGSTTNYFHVIAPNKCECFEHNAATGYEEYKFEYQLKEYCDISSIIQEAKDAGRYESMTSAEWILVVRRYNKFRNPLFKQLAA